MPDPQDVTWTVGYSVYNMHGPRPLGVGRTLWGAMHDLARQMDIARKETADQAESVHKAADELRKVLDA